MYAGEQFHGRRQGQQGDFYGGDKEQGPFGAGDEGGQVKERPLFLKGQGVEQRIKGVTRIAPADIGMRKFLTQALPQLTIGINLPKMTVNFSFQIRSEEHTSELQSRPHLVCRLLLENI